MRAVLALALAGCGFSVSPSGTTSDANDASSIDSSVDACVSFSRQLDTCGHTGTDLTLTGMNTFDTDTGVLTAGITSTTIKTEVVVTQTNMVEVRAIYVGNLTLAMNAQLRAVGSRPLAIVAYGKVTLQGGATIDVGAGGAGAPTACTPGPTKGEDDGGGAAGGGGGGYQGVGAHGGNGNKDGGGSDGGMAGPLIAMPDGPRGGCPGAPGGVGGDPGGEGGLGGGAVFIVSADEIQLLAMAGINAGGAGGGGGQRINSGNGDAGGGGGGSGGMILLEAPRIRSAGILAANGGGGGEGSGNGSAGMQGARGALSMMKATGGGGQSPTGTDGGKGAAGNALGGESPGDAQNGGAGGGGGGAGFIIVRSPDPMLGSMVSPDAAL